MVSEFIFTSTPCGSSLKLHLHPLLSSPSLMKRIFSLMWVRRGERAHGVPIMEGFFILAIPCAPITACPLLSPTLPPIFFFLLSDHSYVALTPTLIPNDTMSSSSASSSPLTPGAEPCTRNWSISDDSLRRYVSYASESCIQELLSASDSSRADSSDSWKVLSVDDGVEISKRCSGSLHVFRSRRLLRSISPKQFIVVANAIDAAKQWDPDLVEANYIKALSSNLSIVHLRFGDASKPLFKNREFIVYERRETMDDGTLDSGLRSTCRGMLKSKTIFFNPRHSSQLRSFVLKFLPLYQNSEIMVVAVASLPKEIAAGLQPKRNNSIRGLLLQSGWVVEKLEDDSCMVTYVIQLDPAGWLPKFFVNRVNTKLVMIIDNLKKLAQACP